MSRVVVIGATGHIGSYLVPGLVRGGHESYRFGFWMADALDGCPLVGPGWVALGLSRPSRRALFEQA
jgi:hypothetical protein